MSVVVLGLDSVVGFFRGLIADVKQADNTIVLVGSPLAYARPVETGIRKGQEWRRGGGAHMLQRGLDEEIPSIRREVTKALEQGKNIGPVLLAAGYRVQRRTQTYTPVRTGTLRRSFHTSEEKR